MPNKPGTGDLYTSNNEFNANVTLTVGNTTVNTSANSTMLRLANSTVSSNLGIGGLQVGSAVVNTTTMLIGNSTVNTVIGNTTIAIGNTTVNAVANATMLKISNSTAVSSLSLGLLALPEGGVINWDSGDMTLTQAADVLTFDFGIVQNPQFIIRNSADTGEGPEMLFEVISASPAAADVLADIMFYGRDSATNQQQYAVIRGTLSSPTSTSESGQITLFTQTAGSSTGQAHFGGVGGGVCIGASGNPPAGGTGCLKLDGGQIEFPVSKNASTDANTLDDYEEGTWTPAMTFNNSATGVTYSTQNGTYTLVGRMMQVYGFISLTSNGTGVGTARITGFPIASGIGHIMPGAGKCSSGGSAATGIFPYMGNGAATATLCIPQATATTDATDTNCTDTFNITFQMNYYLD